MSITTDDYITFISFGLSALSIVLVIFLIRTVRLPPRPEYHSIEGPPQSETEDDNAIEVSAVVSEFSQRLKRLEEGLVDLRVKLEILDLRVNRGSTRLTSSPSPAPNEETSRWFTQETVSSPTHYSAEDAGQVPHSQYPASKTIGQRSNPASASSNIAPVDRRPGSTEMEALRIVSEGLGRITAKEIQQKIGRTREHTARMMNSLYHEGLVERDVTARPFSYRITQKGRDALNE
jgi:predicted transcriptional regulator